MNSIIVAVLVGLATWIFIKATQKARQRRVVPDNSSVVKQKAMPRIGTPETITEEQISLLKKNFFKPAKSWSYEEAAIILDATTYLRAVCVEVLGSRDQHLRLQNELLNFMLADQGLREYILKWGKDRRQEGLSHEKVVLKHNQQFDRVAEAVRKFAENG